MGLRGALRRAARAALRPSAATYIPRGLCAPGAGDDGDPGDGREGDQGPDGEGGADREAVHGESGQRRLQRKDVREQALRAPPRPVTGPGGPR